MELITFDTICGRFTLKVKNQFIEQCPKYLELLTFNLFVDYKMINYLHTIKRNSDGKTEKWENGSLVKTVS